MFELSQIPADAPLAFIALAVFYNLVRHALNLHHQRKQEAEDAATHERIIALSSELAEARSEIKYLREEVRRIKEKGA
nr:MAG: hypothetical protein [Bacteriophage sp.]